jgi:hypothetical protein
MDINEIKPSQGKSYQNVGGEHNIGLYESSFRMRSKLVEIG